MEHQKYSPASLRLMLITVSAVLFLTVIAVIVTVLSGADRTTPDQVSDDNGTDPHSNVTRPGTEDAIGETDLPVVLPDPDETEPGQPTIQPMHWYMPVEGGFVAKEHDLTKQVFSVTMNDYRVHCGIDLQVPIGADVLAAADGVIETIYTDPFEGSCLRITHANGFVSLYKNLAPEQVEGLKEGDEVVGGQVLGSVGESAIIEISDEPHLHYELYREGRAVDPLSVLPYSESDASFAE